jgi:hypothetical protein
MLMAEHDVPLAGRTLQPRAEIGDLAAEERHILECLGAAVVSVRGSPPRSEQRAIFECAAAQAPDTTTLRKQIAQFLNGHHELRRA